ncbi:MAG: penicillin-binding transpeptidase domain-containing protein [Anaerolineales bacterium]
MRSFTLILLAGILVACGPGGLSGELPTPQINTNSAPDPESVAHSYLAAWNEGEYGTMYDLLSTQSRNSISLEDFQARYGMVATQTNLYRVDYEILQALTNPQSAQVGYRLTLNSAVVGQITRDTSMDLILEGGQWRVVYDDRIILPELAGGNTLSLERFVPARGVIYDRNGTAIAVNTEAVAVGVYPGLIEEDDVDTVVSELARVAGVSVARINEIVFPEDGEPDYYEPIAEVSADQFNARAGDWNGLSGIFYQPYNTRLYLGGGVAPQTVGYYGPIPAEEVPNYIPLGYQSDDNVGRMGIESWGEEYLAGTRGGILRVLNQAGEVVTILAQSQAQPAASIYTTLDATLQLAAQEANKYFTGAIVVLERDTGKVLAMVSTPGFNPTWADPNGFNSFWQTYFNELSDAPRFFNKAAQGQYPPGSIFKPIPFSAALESGLWQPESTLDCVQQWYGLSGIILEDWTLEKELPPSGTLNLLQGLMRSCNPWFYQIGLDLYNNGMTDAVTEMARGFGLGSRTGIQVVPEEPGSLSAPDAQDAELGRNQAVQQAFGQGTTLITPLQAALYAAAIGNGGTLYQPQLIQSVVDANGVAILNFEPQANGTLPISSSTLLNLQNAMQMVVADPRGTAYRQFSGFQITVHGKTGTATAGEGLDPHAWFIGYTNEGQENQPDIAIAVLVENIGDGSELAAPIFRRVASYYFFNSPGPVYPWESDFGVFDPTYFEETPEGDEGTPTPDNGAIQVTPSN